MGEWANIVDDILEITTLRRIAMQGIGEASASQRVVDVLAGTGSRITHLNLRGAFNRHHFADLFRSLTSLVELSTCELRLVESDLISTPPPSFQLRVLSAPQPLSASILRWLTSASEESLEVLDGEVSADLSSYTNLRHLRLYAGNVIKTAHDPHPLPLLPSSPNLTLSLDPSDKYGMVAVTVFEILESLQQLPVKLVRLRGLHLNPNTGKPKFLLAKEHEEIEQRWKPYRDMFDMEEWWSGQIVRRSS